MTEPAVTFRDIVLIATPEMGLAVVCRRCSGSDGDVMEVQTDTNMWDLVRAVAAHVTGVHT